MGTRIKKKTSSCVGFHLQRSSPMSSLCDLAVCRQTRCWKSSWVSYVILQATGSGLGNWHDLSIDETSKPASLVTHFLVASCPLGSIFSSCLVPGEWQRRPLFFLTKSILKRKHFSRVWYDWFLSKFTLSTGRETPHQNLSLPSKPGVDIKLRSHREDHNPKV